MDKLPMCRICLAENVGMYIVTNRNLHELYEKLTDNPFMTEDSRPILACFFCCAKLKQCYRLLRQCLEAEELFAQRMNEDYKPNPLINQDHLKFYSGFIKSPTENISIVDVVQTETIAIKEELPAVSEVLDIIEPKEEHQSDELELENLDNNCLDVADIPPHHSESDLEDGVPLMEFKTEVEAEQEVSKMKRRARDTIKLELENVDNNCLDVADIPPHHSESDLEDGVPLIEFKTEVEAEQEVSKKKRRARETIRATVTKKPKLDTRRIEEKDAITAEQTRKDKSDSNVTRTTQKRTSKPCKGAVTKHIRIHTGAKSYKCDICQHSFSEKGTLKIHNRIHTGEKPYKCDICQRSFRKEATLTRHIRIHTGEKPYKCDICQRSFSYNGTLTRHTRIHAGEKPYKCDICQYSFRVKSTLTTHIRIHTGQKPYKCDICQHSFMAKSTLTRHIRIHTGQKPYKCDICQHSFMAKSTLTRHIRIHTGQKPYKCDICQRSFSEKRSLTRHIRIHTGEICTPPFCSGGHLGPILIQHS